MVQQFCATVRRLSSIYKQKNIKKQKIKFIFFNLKIELNNII